MAYVRKTVDEFELIGIYPNGPDLLTTENTRKLILQRRKEYRENAPGVEYQIVKRRVPIKTGN